MNINTHFHVFRYRILWWFSCGVALCLTACATDIEPLVPTAQRTVLVYLAGDNNLSDEVAQKSAALLAGWDASMGQLIVVADEQGKDAPYLLRARAAGRPVHGGQSQSCYDTLRRYAHHNSASPELLATAIADMQRFAPAESYGLVLFSHATGWLPQGALDHPTTWHESLRRVSAPSSKLSREDQRFSERFPLAHKLSPRNAEESPCFLEKSPRLAEVSPTISKKSPNVSPDAPKAKTVIAQSKRRPALRPRTIFEDRGREMTLSELQRAIPDSLFRFIAFDMCFMSGVEVAYALRHKAPELLGSAAEMLSPGFTPLYASHLRLFYRETPDLKGFAEAFFQHYNALAGVYRSATISVVRTAHLEELRDFTQRLQRKSRFSAPHDASGSSALQEATAHFAGYPYTGVQHFDRNGAPHLFYDLADYLNALIALNTSPHEAIVAGDSLSMLMQNAVSFARHTPQMINISLRSHCGLSIFLPHPSLPDLNAAYRRTDWGKEDWQ